jgi:molybdopterin converting factor small subunit
VGEVLQAAAAAHPGLGERIFEAPGKVRRFVNVFVGEEDIRHAQGLDTPVPEGQTVSILPAVAGGEGSRA